jgi:hypothetical protein
MDADMANQRLYLRETKNGALRVLPISEFALSVLQSLPDGATGDKVFAGVDASRLSVYSKRVFSARDSGRELSHSAAHGSKLARDGGGGSLRGGTDTWA